LQLLDFDFYEAVPVALHSLPHLTAVLLRIPSKSAMTGAGRSEANAANAVFLACRPYKPRAANCAAR
jgi:hypothetical protein